jgi:microcystin-dependent protein
MTQNSYPFDSQSISEADWSVMALSWRGSGTDLADPTSLAVAAGTGLTADVSPGLATVRGHYYESTAVEVVSFGTNSSGDPRKDRVILRLDPSANSIVLAVLAGTPGASPIAPTLTQTATAISEISLAVVTVVHNAGSVTGQVVDSREGSPDLAAPAGTIVAFAGTVAPLGWSLAEGQSLTVDSYPALHAAIGYTYGGSGANFSLPDMRGRHAQGLDAVDFQALGADGGSKSTTLSAAQLPTHDHDMEHWHDIDHNHSINHSHTATIGSTSAGNAFVTLAGDIESGGVNVVQSNGGAAAHTHSFQQTSQTPLTSGQVTPVFGTTSTGAPQDNVLAGTDKPNTGTTGTGASIDNMGPYLVTTHLVKVW